MTRILLVVPRAHVHAAVEALYDLQLVHVHDHTEGRYGLELGKPLEGASEASETLIRLRAMIATLGIADRDVDRALPVERVMEELEAKFEHLESEIETAGENRNRLRNESRNIEQRIASLEPFISLGLDLDLYMPYENVDVIVGQCSGDIQRAMDRTDIPYELFRPKDPSKTGIFALFVDTDRGDETRAILGELNYQVVPVFEGEGDPRAVRVTLKEGLAKVNTSLEEVELDIKRIRKIHGDTLVAAEEHLSIEVEKAESPLRCGGTPNALFMEGWLPAKRLSHLRKTLDSAVGDAYHVEVIYEEEERAREAAEVAADGGEEEDGAEEEGDHHEDVVKDTPVMLRNPEGVKVHEFLVGLVSTPRYDEIDPSIFMYLTFPVLFGIMVGDIGYGIAFILAGMWLKRTRWKGVGIATGKTRLRLTQMIQVAGGVTILFGILFGELFGFELFGSHGIIWPHYLYVPALELYLPINRLEEAMLMIKLCVYIGMFHILLGLAIGFANEAKHHGALHAFLAKGSWWLILIGGFIIFKLYFSGAAMGTDDPATMLGLIMLLAGILMLLAGEGMGGVLELPGIVSNIMSYTRLFAIGLSSLGIAMTFNNLGEMVANMGDGGVIAAIFGVIVAVLGHTINMFLALLAPSLHALRLHYVEWMTKFYTGGGTPYEPFGRERKYTEV